MNVTTLTRHLPKGLHRAGLLIKKFSPQILTASGLVFGGLTVVSAVKATRKFDDVMDDHKEILYKIDAAQNYPGEYDESDAKHDLFVARAKLAGDIVKLYAPTAVLGLTSAACVLGSYGVMNKRNAAIAMAYSMVEGKFREYRQRVVEDLGEDKDKSYLFGTQLETITLDEVDEETGKKKKVKQQIATLGDDISQYAKFFDDSSRYWQDDSDLNIIFLRAQQNWANDLLHSRGHLFLNEVYDSLGLPRTKQGAIVGWVLDHNNSDNYVDFGIYNAYNLNENRDFINGYQPFVLLDFNVDGVIYDLI